MLTPLFATRSITIVLSVVVLLNLFTLSFAQRRRIPVGPTRPVNYVSDQRLLNWCVTGEDEPELQYYPFSDFVPYFKKSQRNLVRQKDASNIAKYDYEFQITNVRYKEASTLRGELHNVGHFKFQAYVLRESALGIKEKLNPKYIQGLAVQINWAPSGIGLPGSFAFVDPNLDIICFDCISQHGVPLGCRRRPHNAIIHPTMLIYHHKMKLSTAFKERLKEREQVLKDDAAGEKQRNDDRIARLIAAGVIATAGSTAAPKIAPVVEKCLTKLDKSDECRIRSILSDHTDDSPENFQGEATEIHGTLHWFLPPCSVTKFFELQFLVIHNFAAQEFEAFTLGPYEIPEPPLNPQGIRYNPYVPSPFFHGFKQVHECDNEQNTIIFERNYGGSGKIPYPFSYSRSYEECLRNVEGYKSNSDLVQVCNKPEPSRCDSKTSIFDPPINYTCELARCASSISTTPRPDAMKNSTRGVHGGINIVTNFCLQPLFIFVGRYYKETFNRCSVKGHKLWFWIHMLGGGAASVCQYVGYFHPKFVEGSFHVFFGNIMIMMLAITYVSAWIRHKNEYATAAAEFVHGLAGYIVSFLAFLCLHTAPGLSITALSLVYATTMILSIGYLIMEFCICALDYKFGMKPCRRHFPTIEARFDDLPVQGSTLRIVLLIFMTILMLILTIVSSFV